MARTPDRRAGPLYEEKIVLEQVDEFGDPIGPPDEIGGVTYPNGGFALKDSRGILNPREVSASDTDTTTASLSEKLVAGTGIDFELLSQGGNEQLRIEASGVSLPLEFTFVNKKTVVVGHHRGQRPLVQVILPAVGYGYNSGTYNEPFFYNMTFSGPYERYPDDQYTLVHLNQNIFKITFDTQKTGKVIYF